MYCPKCKSKLYPGDEEYMNKCGVCSYCITFKNKTDREKAIDILTRETGLSIENLPDGLPIEDFVDENGNLDYDGISAW